MAANSLGDRAVGSVIDFKFNTHDLGGAPITLAGSPALACYKGNSTTEDTDGITLTVDFDGRTGMHHVSINTAADGTFYSSGGNFQVVITAGTVDSISVVGAVVAEFTLGLTQTAAGAAITAAEPIAADVIYWDGVEVTTPLETAQDVADAVWVKDITGSAVDTAGAVLEGVDTATTGIKAKTDSLTFTLTGQVDANIKAVIDDPVVAGSAKETNWGGTA